MMINIHAVFENGPEDGNEYGVLQLENYYFFAIHTPIPVEAFTSVDLSTITRATYELVSYSLSEDSHQGLALYRYIEDK